ncbi:transporter substrate-binding domain-containing protein [Rheinheimera sp. MMS21-TC3]|uniref:transporter substrate-binding domain-containing protein n=1 Tax=Rheinheimera sp. MMS21-TC3 TaxID=3072790 RepID=UPI0028C39410|nr:transporter substrate-binding domain-containing protein [Rheinheimera sp. MMS21-TC3]WNO61915.1 transporter substrate-binding domain-containing protein [Rheinheimera sp. MMS21-TC3]
MKQGFSALVYLVLILIMTSGHAALPSPLKITISKDIYPYMYLNQHGQAEGLVVDYWRQLAQQQDIEVQFFPATWPETLAMLERGEVHLHGALAGTPARAKQYELGDLDITIYSNVFIHRDMPHFTSVHDLKPLTIGVIKRSSHIATLQELIPNANLAYYSSIPDLYDAAVRGELFAFSAFDNLPVIYADYKTLNALFPLYRKMPIARNKLSYAVYENPALFQQLQIATNQIEPTFIANLEQSWLSAPTDKDTLQLGVSVNNPPYMHITAGGEAKGLIIELWQAWAEQTGKKIAFVPDSSANNVQNLEQGRIDAVVALPMSELISQRLKEAYHLYNFNSALFYPKHLTNLSLSKLNQATIAVFQNAPYITELKGKYPQLTFKRYVSLEEMLVAVQQQEAIGFIGGSAIMPIRFQQLNVADRYKMSDELVIETGLYTFVQTDNQELLETIHQGFANLDLEQLEAIEKRWLNEPDRYYAKFRHKVPLPLVERTWLNTHQPIRLGIVKDWPPMEFLDSSGEAVGITIDIINLIAQRLDTVFEIKAFESFAELRTALTEHEIDIVGGLGKTSDENAVLSLTEPYWSSHWAAISSVSSNKVIDIDQLAGKRIAIYKEYTLAAELPKRFVNSEITLTKDLKQAISLLQYNEVDIVIDTVETAGQFLRDTGYVNLQIQVLEGLTSEQTMFGVRVDYQPLVKMLNKGIRSLGEDGEKQVYKKWFDFQINQGLDKTSFTRLMLQLGGAVSLIIVFFIIWNLSLRKEVNLRRIAEEKMRFMATHDDLTQLPNRSLLKERLQQALLQHARHNETLALLFIDLDGFKDINDKYGHDVGDELLQSIVVILQDAVRKTDTVARFGGDEFVILLTGLMHRHDAAIIAEKVLQQLQYSMQLSIGAISIGASIGIAIYPEDGTDADKLLKVADNLMYRVKQQGKNQYCFSKPSF